MLNQGSDGNTASSVDPVRVERAYLLGIADDTLTVDEADVLLDELAELLRNLGIEPIGRETVRLRQFQSRFLLGTGKAYQVKETLEQSGADCLVFDRILSPAQQRNWERLTGITVIDRHEVILDIFNDRATTKEASLQVELARLEYELPRLRRAWSHLDRQRGGGAIQRDAGETQLELDQRMIRQRIARLRTELAQVVKQREVQRKQRRRVPVPTAAIVGYTNAGKSSLLNRLTDANVLAADKLFATLDPTTRRMQLPSGNTLLLTDTVGFVRNLPHRLVEAFKATLEEAVVADFLIHVIDASSKEAEAQRMTTLNVLKELGADQHETLTVFNKIDLVDDPIQRAALHRQHPHALFVSAHTGEGIDELLAAIEQLLEEHTIQTPLLIPHDRHDLIHRLHEAGAVQTSRYLDRGIYLETRLPQRWSQQFKPYNTTHDSDLTEDDQE